MQVFSNTKAGAMSRPFLKTICFEEVELDEQTNIMHQEFASNFTNYLRALLDRGRVRKYKKTLQCYDMFLSVRLHCCCPCWCSL